MRVLRLYTIYTIQFYRLYIVTISLSLPVIEPFVFYSYLEAPLPRLIS